MCYVRKSWLRMDMRPGMETSDSGTKPGKEDVIDDASMEPETGDVISYADSDYYGTCHGRCDLRCRYRARNGGHDWLCWYKARNEGGDRKESPAATQLQQQQLQQQRPLGGSVVTIRGWQRSKLWPGWRQKWQRFRCPWLQKQWKHFWWRWWWQWWTAEPPCTTSYHAPST